ncbi:MAG: c-type cytochrome [Chitinophagales bacterium]
MAVAAGQPVSVSKCQTCHQADGSGLADMNPSLIKSKQITGDKQRLIELMISGYQ